MRQREEDLKWGVHNTWHSVQQPRGHMILWSTWLVDVNTHPRCLAKGILPVCPGLFWLATASTVSSTRAD